MTDCTDLCTAAKCEELESRIQTLEAQIVNVIEANNILNNRINELETELEQTQNNFNLHITTDVTKVHGDHDFENEIEVSTSFSNFERNFKTFVKITNDFGNDSDDSTVGIFQGINIVEDIEWVNDNTALSIKYVESAVNKILEFDMFQDDLSELKECCAYIKQYIEIALPVIRDKIITVQEDVTNIDRTTVITSNNIITIGANVNTINTNVLNTFDEVAQLRNDTVILFNRIIESLINIQTNIFNKLEPLEDILANTILILDNLKLLQLIKDDTEDIKTITNFIRDISEIFYAFATLQLIEIKGLILNLEPLIEFIINQFPLNIPKLNDILDLLQIVDSNLSVLKQDSLTYYTNIDSKLDNYHNSLVTLIDSVLDTLSNQLFNYYNNVITELNGISSGVNDIKIGVGALAIAIGALAVCCATVLANTAAILAGLVAIETTLAGIIVTLAGIETTLATILALLLAVEAIDLLGLLGTILGLIKDIIDILGNLKDLFVPDRTDEILQAIANLKIEIDDIINTINTTQTIDISTGACLPANVEGDYPEYNPSPKYASQGTIWQHLLPALSNLSAQIGDLHRDLCKAIPLKSIVPIKTIYECGKDDDGNNEVKIIPVEDLGIIIPDEAKIPSYNDVLLQRILGEQFHKIINAICVIENDTNCYAIAPFDQLLLNNVPNGLTIDWVLEADFPKRDRNTSKSQTTVPYVKPNLEWKDLESIRKHTGKQYGSCPLENVKQPLTGFFKDEESGTSYFEQILALMTIQKRIPPGINFPKVEEKKVGYQERNWRVHSAVYWEKQPDGTIKPIRCLKPPIA